jgi:imidazolonepropionase-like amidohydrolase
MKIKSLFASCALLFAVTGAQQSPVIISAGTVLDGRGYVLHNVQIVIQNGKVQRIDHQAKAAATYDLRRVTVLPGWIDVHDHITWHFGPNGRAEDKDETPAQAALAEAGNAWTTLMAGFTTIQSVGSPEDKDLRAAISSGAIPGPRAYCATSHQ